MHICERIGCLNFKLAKPLPIVVVLIEKVLTLYQKEIQNSFSFSMITWVERICKLET
jgi:hypothetical protein